MTCKDCVHYDFCDNLGCFEDGIGDNTDYMICKSSFKDKSNYKEVVRGEWKQITETMGWSDVDCAECSACKNTWVLGDFDMDDIKDMFHFCPNCGCDMRSEQ